MDRGSNGNIPLAETLNMKDFLLEHYRQVNENLRESDRKRNIFVGFYLVFVSSILGFIFGGNPPPDDTLKLIFLGSLGIGLVIAYYTAVARAWHCEYNYTAMAIHKCFIQGNFDLSSEAQKLKASEDFGPYCNPKGTEFWVMVLVLFILASELSLIAQQIFICDFIAAILTTGIFIFVLVIGILLYSHYLKKRENEFPQKSHLILKKDIMIPIIEEHDLYEVGTLTLVGDNPDRKFAPNIDHGGKVHLNVLEPGARAGNHYHQRIQEFFINPGPDKLILHLKNPQTGSVETVEMQPPSLSKIRTYHAKSKIPHMVENTGPQRASLIILVDKDDPNDTYASNVYETTVAE